MEPLKSGFGVMRAIVPVLYCGGLFYYFAVGGSGQEAMMIGLGPNLLIGMGVGSLLLCIPLILKIARIFARAHSAGVADAPRQGDDGGAEADAVIARYMARRSMEAVPNIPAARTAYTGGAPVKPSGFGRRGR